MRYETPQIVLLGSATGLVLGSLIVKDQPDHVENVPEPRPLDEAEIALGFRYTT